MLDPHIAGKCDFTAIRNRSLNRIYPDPNISSYNSYKNRKRIGLEWEKTRVRSGSASQYDTHGIFFFKIFNLYFFEKWVIFFGKNNSWALLKCFADTEMELHVGPEFLFENKFFV